MHKNLKSSLILLKDISWIKIFYTMSILLILVQITTLSYAKEFQIVKGAGPSTFITTLFFETFSKEKEAKGYKFRIPLNSVKHAGGIESSEEYIFGRTGRPLNESEKLKNKAEIFLCRIPVSFAVGSGVSISSLTLKEIKGIYTGKILNWKAVGGPEAPITKIGREKTEALLSELKKQHPFFETAKFDKVVGIDDAVVNILKSKWGKFSIGFGAKQNFDEANILSIHVDDLSVTLNVGLVYDKKNSSHPLVQSVLKFAHSDQWAEIVKTFNLLPPE